MPAAYVKPGVSVSELVNPSFQPIEAETTDICIIGVGAGFQQKTDIVQLLDNNAVELSVDDGIDLSNLVVSEYADPTVVYDRGTTPGSSDYYIDGNTIQRSLQSLVRNGETVLVAAHNTNGDFQELVTLNGLGVANHTDLATHPAGGSDTLTLFSVQRQGRIPIASGTGATPSTDDGLWIQTDTSPMKIKVIAGSTSIPQTTKQTVYLDYIDEDAIQQQGVAVTLNGTSFVNLPGATPALSGNNVVALVARNVNDPTQNGDVIHFVETSDSDAVASPASGSDVEIVLVDEGASTWRYQLYRYDSPSTIPDGTTVRVSYTATPSNYFLPTRCFSLADVEDKYGAGLAGDSDPDGFATGSIKSPVSFAAQLAFSNGAESVVIQVLFNESVVGNTTFRFAATDPSSLTDWTATLRGLRSIEDINLIVPLVATSGSDNGNNQGVFQAVQDHITYMIDNEHQYLQAIFGEDSTFAGQAGATTLRSHAQFLAARPASYPEALSLISPAAFKLANPVTGQPMSVGGQYIAAALAGSIATQPMQQSLTRHPVGGVIDIIDSRTESEKDTDAKAGLMVIESRRGVIQIRHGLTVAVNSVNTREFSVIRSKHHMIESIRQTLDEQVIGQMVADSRAAFSVQLLVESVLENMVEEGTIVTYDGVTATLTNLDPTTISVRFQYLPAYPLNYVQITFAINTSTSVITATDTEV